MQRHKSGMEDGLEILVMSVVSLVTRILDPRRCFEWSLESFGYDQQDCPDISRV